MRTLHFTNFVLGAVTGLSFSYYYLRRDIYTTSRAVESTIVETNDYVKKVIGDNESLEKRISELEKQIGEQTNIIRSSENNIARLSKRVKQIYDALESAENKEE
ncbi:hypothetical protein ABK040_003379 [Willaertia magna]